ncbi:MAG TPA: TetR/AcrR family transcriptional regulator [Steroidobacteraceae bacterium]|nr:TetR/AcrR family transcriptional regulator [Steroidobacteraceae bacterium]
MAKIDNKRRPNLPASERILLTAHDLFYREGIRATGIDRVIAEAGVTKVTFYRHFPSKNALICAFLEHRHQRWMAWFIEALQRHGGASYGKGLDALVPTLAEWFRDESFRGCAFINSVGELGGTLSEVVKIARRHKQEMTNAIASLLPVSARRKQDTQAVALAVDGAIVRAQFDETPDAALKALSRLLNSIAANSRGSGSASSRR